MSQDQQHDDQAGGDDGGGYTMSFFVGGHELTREDFGHDVFEWVAYRIAMTGATHCGDKAALLELLRYQARTIVEKVSTIAVVSYAEKTKTKKKGGKR